MFRYFHAHMQCDNYNFCIIFSPRGARSAWEQRQLRTWVGRYSIQRCSLTRRALQKINGDSALLNITSLNSDNALMVLSWVNNYFHFIMSFLATGLHWSVMISDVTRARKECLFTPPPLPLFKVHDAAPIANVRAFGLHAGGPGAKLFSHCSSGPPVHFTHQTLTISSFGSVSPLTE